jgi:hypothetical protein
MSHVLLESFYDPDIDEGFDEIDKNKIKEISANYFFVSDDENGDDECDEDINDELIIDTTKYNLDKKRSSKKKISKRKNNKKPDKKTDKNSDKKPKPKSNKNIKELEKELENDKIVDKNMDNNNINKEGVLIDKNKTALIHKPDEKERDFIKNISIFKNRQMSKLTNPDILQLLYDLKKKWNILPNTDKLSLFDRISMIYTNFNIDVKANIDDINSGYLLCKKEVDLLYMLFIKKKLITEDPYDEYWKNISQIYECISYSNHVISSLMFIKQSSMPNYDPVENVDKSFMRISTPQLTELEDTEGYLKLLCYMEETLSFHKCKRYQKEYVCQEYYIGDYASHFWDKKWTIEEFVSIHTQKDTHFQWWKIRETGDNYKKLLTYLKTRLYLTKFPDIERQSGVYTFNNGVYNARHVDKTGKLMYKFYSFNSDEYIPSNLISCKKFDCDFEDKYDDWRKIPTPDLDTILDFQFKMYGDQYEGIYELMMVSIGRVLSPINMFDKYSYVPCLIGNSGTGKSTITIKLVQHFFQNEDVGILQSKGRANFGWQNYIDSKLIIAPELRSDTNIDPTFLQSAISGEDVCIDVMFSGKGIKKQWTAPMMFVSNEELGLSDSNGSIARRFLQFIFSRKIPDNMKDLNLDDKLFANLPMTMHKCNMAYIEFRERVGSDDIWNHVPDYFKRQRDNIKKQNAIYSFLSSDKLKFGPEFKCEFNSFSIAYKHYCKELCSSNKFKSLTKMDTIGPFQDHNEKFGTNIKVVDDLEIITNGIKRITDGITGVALVD